MGFIQSAIRKIEYQHNQNFVSKEGGPQAKRVDTPQGPVLYTGGGADVVYAKKNEDGSVTVTVNGEEYDFTEAEARSLTIDTGSGNDVVSVSGDIGIAVRGQAGDDVIYGGDGADDLDGGSGSDKIYGGDGDDNINGGTGNDVLEGQDGADTMNGGHGLDTMHGGDGDDTMNGNTGNDVIRGGDGNDTMNGGWGDDYMEGGDGNDYMNGGWGSDDVFGNDGNDSLWGGPQRKRRGIFKKLFFQRDQDNLDGGAGRDTINGRPEWSKLPDWIYNPRIEK